MSWAVPLRNAGTVAWNQLQHEGGTLSREKNVQKQLPKSWMSY